MQVGFRQSLQIKCFYEGSSAMIQLVKISQLLFAYLIVLNNYNDNATEALVASLLHVNIAQVLQYFRNFTSLQILDYLHHDILPDKEVTVSVPP
jgi:AraC-like DNA-binding protein